MRQPRLAELVAGSLRERIVHGELADGDVLPPLEQLAKEFGVGPPSAREALRILEHEGLITVRRGNVGGAVVRRPSAEDAAYMLGLVLQSEQTSVPDLAAALSLLESLCARLCALRADRNETVVPALREVHERADATIDNPALFAEYTRKFHEALVAGCDNKTIMLVASSLVWLWTEQSDAWAYRVTVLDELPDLGVRDTGLKAHFEILKAIERGDASLAEHLVCEHHAAPEIYPSPKGGASALRCARAGSAAALPSLA
jgi:GntR family transcriptional repressor for pyruvate dehydrogenase complex